MKLHVLTLCLNGMPWIATQWTNLVKCGIDWTWHIVEGAAANTHCTSWCKRIPPQYSCDGTDEFLKHVKKSPRVKLYRKPMWDGKLEMVNAPLPEIQEPCVLLQMDSDEIWTGEQLSKIATLLSGKETHAYFWCRYFFGVDIAMTSRNCYGNNPNQDWKRAWKFTPGDTFISHEPPKLSSENDDAWKHESTNGLGLVFDHYGYATEKQVAFKEDYYGYGGAVVAWRKLQDNDRWPVKLAEFLPWVKDPNCEANRI